jgi:uncharacterized protein (TIGR00251 family)
MKIKVKVHSNSSNEKINKLNDLEYEIWIKEKPIDGKANVYLEKFLRKYFRKDIKMISGFNSRIKFFEI